MLNNSIQRIKGIQFGLWNSEEIRQYAVCEIASIDLYDKVAPKPNGLFDLRMGPSDPKFSCYTCQQSIYDCPGHFGFINLVKPVYIPHFMEAIKKVLSSVCHNCSALKVPHDSSNPRVPIKNSVALNLAYQSSKEKLICMECEEIQPKVSNDHLGIYFTHSNAGQSTKEKTMVTAEEALDILCRIKDEDLVKIGFSKTCRPEWMIFDVFPVAPPCVRPSVFHDGGARSENDLSHKYLDILKCNIALKKEIQQYHQKLAELKEKTPKDDKYDDIIATFRFEKERNIEKRYEHLQTHATTIMNNKIPGITSKNRSGRPFKCFSDRLASKTGRIRGNLMGKRTDFSSRSVITPDPCLGIDELGVPIWIAMKLTVKEQVNQFNQAYLREMVRNGAQQYPGAMYIIKQGEKRYNLEFAPKKLAELEKIEKPTEQELRMKRHWESLLTVEHGDFVERHVIGSNTVFECEDQDNFYRPSEDLLLFNRQPSLWKHSMMGLKARILPFDTFRINANVCTP